MMSDDGPVIVSAMLAPGHDGQAEVVVELLYPNGGRSRLSVTHTAVTSALQSAGVHHLDELAGRPWTVLIGSERRS